MLKRKYRRYSPDLKRRHAKAEQERGFLKDAAVFFAKESK